MTDSLEAKIAAATAQLQALLPNPADVRIDRLAKGAEAGEYLIHTMTNGMKRSGKSSAEILAKLEAMIRHHTPQE